VVAHAAIVLIYARPVVHALASVTFGEFFFAVLLAAALSMWIYWHASRHGSKHATAWGILAFFFWVAVPIYFLHYVVTRRRY
jgi:hypothetical protein